MGTEKTFDVHEILEGSFTRLSNMVMNIKNKQEIVSQLENIAKRAGMMARYIDEREGHGCGDQGHEKAVKAMNKAGRTIWVKAFGYNVFHDLSL